MKTLYLDLSMGAAGDMLTAALLELTDNKEEALSELNSIGVPGVEFVAEDSEKCGIHGTHMAVKIHGEEENEEMHSHHHELDEDDNHDEHGGHHHDRGRHHHASLQHIEEIVDSLNLSDKVKADVKAVYAIIAGAESRVHGVPVSDIHFHEVGTLDAVADVAAVCLLIDRIAPDKTIASAVNTGKGQVRCAHGILPVPAPATAFILKGIPVYNDEISGELCTPTGAALIKYFVNEFAPMLVMTSSAIGYGMGKKNFERANCLRAFLGESAGASESITELSCNIDDMTAEEIGFACEMCFRAGAVEVYTVPAGMKKNRPGTLLCVLCREAEKAQLIKTIFRYTSTIGLRESICRRYTLSRSEESVLTQFGEIRKKVSTGCGVTKEKYEYDDISRIARENGLSISEVLKRLKEEE